MPELPEVETVRRQLRPLVEGRLVVAAGGHDSPRFAEASEAAGARVCELGRRGKYLIAALDGGRDLVVHLGMTGRLRVGVRAAEDPYVRAWWRLDDGSVVELQDVRRFGRVAVVPAGDHRRVRGLALLGPEPLGPHFTAGGLAAATSRSRAPVKALLLAQRVVAGVGNIYADEALWRAGISPAARCLGPAEAERLHAAIVAVLGEAIDHGGTTLRDYRQVTGASGGHQHHLACYGRAGLPCLRCGVRLVRSVVAGRGTTSCAACQPLPVAAAA